MPPWLGTYRLQLHAGFDLAEARGVISYLKALGVSHVYASPMLRARKGSTHGYDVVDPTSLNPELGGEGDRQQFVQALHERDMGLLLDIVPNHMATGAENARWEDVLIHGQSSRFARWFDIDWRSRDPELRGRILLPVLGDFLARVLAREQLSLVYRDNGFRTAYYDQSFPLDPRTLPQVLYLALQALGARLDSEHPDLVELRAVEAALRSLPPRTGRDPQKSERRRREARNGLDRLVSLAERSAEVRQAFVKLTESFHQGREGAIRMRQLLDAQAYRLVYWRRASREINYRRFFDINDLIALRMEDEAVFDDAHSLVLRWVAAGEVNGLRIDHVDGLLDPGAYLGRLVERASSLRVDDGRFPVFVEKILSADEELPESWPVWGTTGYEFLSAVEDVFIDPAGLARIEAAYRGRMGIAVESFDAAVTRGKRRVLRDELSSYVGQLAYRLRQMLGRGFVVAPLPPDAPPLTFNELVGAVTEIIVGLPAYRTYVDPATPSFNETDRRMLARAFHHSRSVKGLRSGAVDLLEALLLSPNRPSTSEAERERLRFIQRFQQLSGPAAAKGVEDTALYVFVPLVSRNDVGCHPGAPVGDAVGTLHQANQARAAQWPRSLLSTTTHDTKRSADVRSRLDVLSELPDAWLDRVARWRRLNRPYRTRVGGRWAPDANTEYLLYQTLVGIWPIQLPETRTAREPWHTQPVGLSVHDRGDLRRRVEQYMIKAVREAKVHTSWHHPDENFETALKDFIAKLLAEDFPPSPFLKDLDEFVGRIARPGLWNSLAKTLVHLTAPGIPDTYQGDELWNFVLVDPDNRAPVDFALRRRLMGDVEAGWAADGDERAAFLRGLIDRAEDSRIKLHVIQRALAARRRWPDLFTGGSYEAMHAVGPAAANLLAFQRRLGSATAITIVPRLTAGLTLGSLEASIGERTWAGTYLCIPEDLGSRCFECALTGRMVSSSTVEGTVAVSLGEALEDFPLALLTAGR